MNEKLSWILCIIAAAVLAVILALPYVIFSHNYCLWDLYAFWAAAQQFFSGRNPYILADYPKELTPSFCKEVCGYAVVEPPVGLVLSLPFYFFSFGNAVPAFLISAVVSLLAIIYLVKNLWSRTDLKSDFFVGILPVLTFTPLFISLYIGQIGIFITLAFTLFLYFFSRAHYFLSGFLLSFSLSKPHLLYLLYFYIFICAYNSKAMRSCIAGFLSGVVVVGIIALLINPEIYAMHLDAMLRIYRPDWMTPTIGSWLYILNPALKKAWVVPMILGIGIAFCYSRKLECSTLLNLLTISLWSFATTPYIWTYDFILCIPILLLLCNPLFPAKYPDPHVAKRILALLGMNALFVANKFHWEYDFWFPWAFLTLWYIVLINSKKLKLSSGISGES